jgi:hypothetical protein
MVLSKFQEHYTKASERVREAGGEMPAAFAASAAAETRASVAVPPPANDSG